MTRHRVMLAAIIAVIALTAACAQSGPAARNASSPRGFRVSGKVVNATTGEPLRGAAVVLLTVQDSQIVASAESGDDGEFAFDSLSAAKFQLTASKRGYSTGFYNQHFEFNSAIVTGPGQDTEHLVFKLAPAGVIYGVVTTDGGDPVEGASVMLFEKPHRHVPGERIEQVQSAQTDDTGAFEFSSLEPGDYLIAVKARPWYANTPTRENGSAQETEAQAALDVAYPLTYFDSTTDESSAATLTLGTGAREQADISLHAVPAVRIQVSVPQRSNGTLAMPSLQASTFGINMPFDDPQVMEPGKRGGVMELAGLAPGSYQLTQGDPPRRVELDAATNQQVDPSAGVPTQIVSGVVQTVSGAPLEDRAMIVLEPANGAGTPIAPEPLAGGSFKVSDVPPGPWLVEAMGQQTQMAVMAIGPRGGKMQAGNRITVEDKPLALVVTVSAGNTRIEGFARNGGKGVAGAMVILVPKDISEIAELGRRDQSDSDGSFALLNVAPGDYTLVAVQDAWGIDWFEPAVISRYLPHGMAVTVKDKSDNTLHLAEPVPVQAR